jgi:hypothetical protein
MELQTIRTMLASPNKKRNMAYSTFLFWSHNKEWRLERTENTEECFTRRVCRRCIGIEEHKPFRFEYTPYKNRIRSSFPQNKSSRFNDLAKFLSVAQQVFGRCKLFNRSHLFFLEVFLEEGMKIFFSTALYNFFAWERKLELPGS